MNLSVQDNCSPSSSVQQRRRGFTLTEIAIVLGIVGLILGAVWAAAKNVYVNTYGTKALEITSVLVANVRGTYGNTAPQTQTDISAAFNNIYYPQSGGALINPTVTAMAGGTYFTISFAGTNKLPGDTVGLGSCQGVVQAAASFGGSVFNTLATAAANQPATVCTAGANGALATCPALAGYSYSCTSSAAASCSYQEVAACPNTGANVGIVAIEIPFSPG